VSAARRRRRYLRAARFVNRNARCLRDFIPARSRAFRRTWSDHNKAWLIAAAQPNPRNLPAVRKVWVPR
jgi:hypothetical protein